MGSDSGPVLPVSPLELEEQRLRFLGLVVLVCLAGLPGQGLPGQVQCRSVRLLAVVFYNVEVFHLELHLVLVVR